MCHLVVIWDTVGVHLGVIWVSFRVIWVSFGCHLGYVGCHLDIIWVSCGGQLVVIWESFGYHLGVIWASCYTILGPEMPVPCNTSAPWRQFLKVFKGMIYVFNAPLNIAIHYSIMAASVLSL